MPSNIKMQKAGAREFPIPRYLLASDLGVGYTGETRSCAIEISLVFKKWQYDEAPSLLARSVDGQFDEPLKKKFCLSSYSCG
jgi:hypothetical protein